MRETKRGQLIATIIGLLLAIFILVMLSVIVNYAMTKSEKKECYGFQARAKEISIFYMTQAEADMCDHYGIDISPRSIKN